MEDNANVDIGIVTPNGIWFKGKIYSCSLAVRQQWFILSEQIGGWPVAVKQQENTCDQIHIYLQDGTTVECSQIDHLPNDSARLMSYYMEFQRLVKLRKELSEKKNPEENIPSDKHNN